MDTKTNGEGKDKRRQKATQKINVWRLLSVVLIVIMIVALVMFRDYSDSQSKKLLKVKVSLNQSSARVEELENELKYANIEKKRSINAQEVFRKQKEQEEKELQTKEEEEQRKKEDDAGATRPSTLVFESLRKYAGSDQISPEKIDFTKDGKYLYVMGNVYIDNAGAYGIWYKKADSAEGWKQQVLTNSTAGLCSNYNSEQIKFFEDYYYISEGLGGSGRIGCYKTEEDLKNNKLYPEIKEEK